MEEEDSPHFHSMKSEQPARRRSKESKKDDKKRKRTRHQDSSPEGGKSSRQSPALHLSSFEPSLKEGPRVSVPFTPMHSLEVPLQSTTPKRTSTPVHKNPASRKTPTKTISYKSRPDDSQSRLTGQPKSSIRHADSISSSSSHHAIVPSEDEADLERSQASMQEEVVEVHKEDQALPEKPSAEKRFSLIEKKLGTFEGGLEFLVKRALKEDKKRAEEEENERVRVQKSPLLVRERVVQEKLEQKRERARVQREREEEEQGGNRVVNLPFSGTLMGGLVVLLLLRLQKLMRSYLRYNRGCSG